MEAVRGLEGRRAGGPLGVHVEDLKGWLQDAMRKKEPVRRKWEILVQFLHSKFREGTPPEELAWATMAILPKVNGGVRVLVSSR